MNTKEAILLESLRLFSRRGYEAVSVRDIAKQLGITQGALYKHYSSKQDIFDSIVNRMRDNDLERAQMYELPEGSFLEMAEAYGNTQMEQIIHFTEAQFRYWTEDEFASSFRKMLTIEQYHNPEMNALYQQYLASGVVGYVEDLFREISQQRDRKWDNPKQLALEFYAPIYMLMNLYDGNENKEEAISQVRNHIDYFMQAMEEKQ
ncbi:TetR/AcrR family transcriptional regulator [Aminipila sp.]|uniref:TetR/AcrR family transcriptional regulator n=1 Tax=Aminipila sp. TaxID=2060095 RepID=UPI00289E782F|nr:helix-turn-helix domain-containing protein [Aminipila sp.]